MIIEQLSGEELINAKSSQIMNDNFGENKVVADHLDQVDDIGYLFHFTQEEINQHVEEIEKGSKVSVFFKESENFTNITILTKDSDTLLARLCGALAINDLNIHDARIFTRRDGIVIDSFSVSDFRSNLIVDSSRFQKIEKDLKTDAQHIKENKDTEHQREHFISLSKNMYELIKTAKPAETVYYQFCPMANDGKGANWLSKESVIKNPYYGSQMLSCGKVVETIKQ